MITALLSIFFSFQAQPTCGDPAAKVTAAERQETRQRVQAVCHEVGAKPIVCDYMDAIVVRESSGRAGVRHTKGKNENGLGPMGLSLRWHADKWPGTDEDPMFCQPEVSALVALSIFHRAFRYRAQNILDVQMIYGGHKGHHGEGRNKIYWITYPPKLERDICARMKRRGRYCRSHVSKRDLGRVVKLGERRALAAKLRQDFYVSRFKRALGLS